MPSPKNSRFDMVLDFLTFLFFKKEDKVPAKKRVRITKDYRSLFRKAQECYKDDQKFTPFQKVLKFYLDNEKSEKDVSKKEGLGKLDFLIKDLESYKLKVHEEIKEPYVSIGSQGLRPGVK